MIEAVVAACTRHPWRVVIVAAVLAGLGGWLAATRFAVNTDTAGLISANARWRHDEIAFARAFPQTSDLVVAVIDAETAEHASAAARQLVAALRAEPKLFHSVEEPDGGPFFRNNGLLFLAPDQLRQTLQELGRARAFLAPLAADPSLRGLMAGIESGLAGVRAGRASLDDLAQPFTVLAGALGRAAAGRAPALEWQALVSGQPPPASARRKLVLAKPVLDYSALEPGHAAIDALRATTRRLGLTADRGVTVRLTGDVPLADEEFATVAQDAPLTLSLTVVAVAIILFLALRSIRIIAAVLVTLLFGLVATTGAGLLLVGELNLISVAFAVLFLGLGVDFGIQFAVRYRAERHGDVALKPALRLAARGVGASLTLAAVSLLAGFLSFLPTAFKGVSELGLIAGLGMAIAYVANLTLLPALLTLLKPPSEPEPMETASLAGVDRWIARNRPVVLAATAAVVVAGAPFLVSMRFDSNPMDLRSPAVQSVSTFRDLARDPDTNPNVIEVMAPSLAAADRLAARIDMLPEVARTVTLSRFVPAKQDEKLAAIEATAAALLPVLSPERAAPPPTDAETIAALHDTAGALRTAAGAANTTGAAAARALADAANALAAAPPERRAAGGHGMMDGFGVLLAQVRDELQPRRITRAALPASLKAQWLAPDGRARIEVSPAGDTSDSGVAADFVAAVRAIAPDATGAPVTIIESGRVVVWSFIEAGLLALAAIFVILVVTLRRPLDVLLTLGPLVIAGIMSLEAAAIVGLPLNFANIIALPLMFGVGVAFHIYYIVAWRAGVVDMLASSLTRAIFFSALTTGAAFGSLCLSRHPGTASMGQLLLIALVFTLLAAFIIVPAFLGPPRERAEALDLEGWAGRPREEREG